MLNVLFFTPLVLFFAAVVLEFCGMLFRKDQVARIAWWLFLAGSGCLSAYLVARGITAGRIPLSNQFEFATAFAWGIAVMLIVLQRRTQAEWIRAAAMPMVFLILSYAALQPREITELMPALLMHKNSYNHYAVLSGSLNHLLSCCRMIYHPSTWHNIILFILLFNGNLLHIAIISSFGTLGNILQSESNSHPQRAIVSIALLS